MLKIIIHDYAGHPFQFDLSKKLSQTFKIYHFYFKNDYGPKANFSNLNFDNLNVEGLGENIIYKKSNLVDRFFKDIKYGKIVSNKINEIKPDIIISGNCPTLSQNIIINSAKRNNSKFIFWIQDFYSEAVEILLKKKLSILAIPIYSLFKFLEKKQLKFSDKLIIISDDFKNKLSKWKINLDNVHYIPNWGNLETIEFFNKKNTKFLIENNLDPEKFYIMYSGTLALKHNPDLIVKIAELNPDIGVIVVSVGSGFDKLMKKKDIPKNIHLFPIQPFNKINEVLSSTDIFLAILNNDSSGFSVPSKILNYLCAGKAIILAAPEKNLASKIITLSNSGKIFDERQINEIDNYIKFLKSNPNKRKELSHNARKYAEENFDIKKISETFKKLINEVSIN